MKNDETAKKKKTGKAARRRKALLLRRRIAMGAGILAAAVLALAVRAAPGVGLYVWGLAALVLAVEALLLCRKRALPKGLYIMLGALCLALLALGTSVKNYMPTDQGLQPSEALVTELKVTDAWPADISRYTGVEALDMRNSTVTDFAPILSMPSLKALDVRGNTAFGQSEYNAIARALPNCAIQWSINIAGQYYDSDTRAIDLSDAGLDADEIAALRAEYPDIEFSYSVSLMGKSLSPDAEAIDLRGAQYVDPDALAAALNLMPNVRTVDLRDTPVSVETAEALKESLPHIEFKFSFALSGVTVTTDDEIVTLPGGTYDDLKAAMACIPLLPNLQYIDARAIVLNASELQAVQNDPLSAKLLFDFTAFGKTLDPLATSLNLDNTNVGSAEAVEAVLQRMPNLQTVSMVNCGLDTADITALCDAHPQIHFIFVVKFGKYQLRTDATAFTTNLYANNKEHYTSATFEPLKYCTDLMMLDIGHCDVTDISFIASMKHLRVLILADNEITDISVLSDKNELEYVELFLNKISDLTPLADKPNLLDLNIYYNPVKDLSPLATDTALERVWLGECGLPNSQINALKKALPNAKVNAKGSASTGRGWREHKRYNVLKQMYKQGVYIPFS